jgi:hypothetical protein
MTDAIGDAVCRCPAAVGARRSAANGFNRSGQASSCPGGGARFGTELFASAHVIDTPISLNPHNPTMDCRARGIAMDSIIYLVGLIVVVMFILSVLGLH